MVKTKNQQSKQKKEKIVLATGKRKTAVARARIKEGTGRIIINDMSIELWQPEYAKLKIREPLLLAEDRIKNLDIKVNVKGGGISSQAEAIRQAIAKGIVEFLKDEKLKNMYLDYDRSLLVFDSRRTEPHKPSRSKKGPRRHKQRSKR